MCFLCLSLSPPHVGACDLAPSRSDHSRFCLELWLSPLPPLIGVFSCPELDHLKCSFTSTVSLTAPRHVCYKPLPPSSLRKGGNMTPLHLTVEGLSEVIATIKQSVLCCCQRSFPISPGMEQWLLKTFTGGESWRWPVTWSPCGTSSGQPHLCQGKTRKSPRISQSPWMPCSSARHSSRKGDLTLSNVFPILGKTRYENYSWHSRDYLFQALHIPGGTKKQGSQG